MRKSTKFFMLAASSASLAGCAAIHNAVNDRQGYYFGNTPDLKVRNVEQFAANQNRILASFIAVALPANVTAVSEVSGFQVTDPTTPEDWRKVVDAGLHYIDVRCDRFVDALFWMNRIRETTSRQIQFTGSAAAAALALIESASRELIGLTPLGFLLVDQTVNNLGQGLLYELDPTAVRILIEQQQTAFLGQLSTTNFTSRALVLQTIQNYAAICLPASIEAEVNRAVGNAQFRRVDYSRSQEEEEDDDPTANTVEGNETDPAANDDKNLAPRIEQDPDPD